MVDYPTKREQFKEFAGKFADNTPNAFHNIDVDTIAVGGYESYKNRDGSLEASCYICKATIYMHIKDIEALKNVSHVTVCPSCYLSGVEVSDESKQ